MDGGPLVASGIPALGLATTYDSNHLEDVWQSYHSPNDRIEFQDAEALGQSGRISEAFLRQLLALKEFPRETSPYLFFEGRGIFKGIPLYALFMVLPLLFGAGALYAYRENRRAKYSSMRMPSALSSPGPDGQVSPLPGDRERSGYFLSSLACRRCFSDAAFDDARWSPQAVYALFYAPRFWRTEKRRLCCARPMLLVFNDSQSVFALIHGPSPCMAMDSREDGPGPHIEWIGLVYGRIGYLCAALFLWLCDTAQRFCRSLVYSN